MPTMTTRKANRSVGETILVKSISGMLVFLIRKSLVSNAQIERFVCHMDKKTQSKK